MKYKCELDTSGAGCTYRMGVGGKVCGADLVECSYKVEVDVEFAVVLAVDKVVNAISSLSRGSGKGFKIYQKGMKGNLLVALTEFAEAIREGKW